MVVVKGNDGTTSGLVPDRKYGVWGDSKIDYGVIGTSLDAESVFGKSNNGTDVFGRAGGDIGGTGTGVVGFGTGGKHRCTG